MRVYVFSVSLVLALQPLVRSRPLPAHLRVALPQRRILLRTRIQPLRHPRQRLPLRKARPLLALVYLDRWPPPRAPSPSDQLLAMASRRCCLAAAPSLHLSNSSIKRPHSKIHPRLRVTVRGRQGSFRSASRRPTCPAVRGTLSNSRR